METYTVRFMYSSPTNIEKVWESVSKTQTVLCNNGCKCSKPKLYRNRNNPGGRIYFKVYCGKLNK